MDHTIVDLKNEVKGNLLNEVKRLTQTLLESYHKNDLEYFEQFEDQKPTDGILEVKIWELFGHNYTIWHHEDYCRLRGNDHDIALHKRQIDKHNQKRNDCVEVLDLIFFEMQKPCACVNSETLGSIIDRLIINELKLYHSIEVNANKERIESLNRQSAFLIYSGNTLFEEMLNGTRCIMPFSQWKMYNTPGLNPKLPLLT